MASTFTSNWEIVEGNMQYPSYILRLTMTVNLLSSGTPALIAGMGERQCKAFLRFFWKETNLPPIIRPGQEPFGVIS